MRRDRRRLTMPLPALPRGVPHCYDGQAAGSHPDVRLMREPATRGMNGTATKEKVCSMSYTDTSASLPGIHAELSRLHRQVLDTEGEFSAEIEAVPQRRRGSARNLVHYLALRRHDIRPLQVELSALGLSSLGRLEAHVLASIQDHRVNVPEPTTHRQRST